MLYVGVDLHGTLITDHPEEIPVRSLPGLIQALDVVKGKARVVACTGNDLGFLERKLPTQVLGRLSGAVLETGCVISDLKTETVLVPVAVVQRVKELEGRLRETRFEWVYKFARRLATVSLFTKQGLRAADFRDQVEREVVRLGFVETVNVTYSSVAVDVIPKGFNKLTGLRGMAQGQPVVGIADSMNDLELIRGADYAFVPANASAELIARLADTGRQAQSIDSAAAMTRGVVLQCHGTNTEGVSEALRFISRHA